MKINFLKFLPEFKKVLKESSEPAFFLYGSEKYSLKKYEKLIVNSYQKKFDSGCEIQNLDGEKIDTPTLEKILTAPPFWGEKKIIVITDFDITKFSAGELKKIENLFENLPEFIILIISQRLLEISTKKTAKWKKFIENHSKTWLVTEFEIFDKMFIERQILLWVKNCKKRMEPELAKLLVFRCGKDLNILKNEIAKVIFLADSMHKDEIEKSEIMAATIESSEASVFDMINAIMEGDKKKAFKILNILFELKEEPVAICGAIANNYVNIFRVKLFNELGKSFSEIVETFGYKGKEFVLRNAAKYSANMSREKINDSIEHLLHADELLKSSDLNPKIVITELLIKLCLR